MLENQNKNKNNVYNKNGDKLLLQFYTEWIDKRKRIEI